MYFEKEVKVVRFFVLVWLVMNITLMPLAAAYDSGNDEVSVVRKVVVLDENGVFGKVTPVTGLQDVSKKGSGENLSLSAMAVWFLLVTLFAGSGYVKYGKKAQFNGTLIVLLAVLTAGVIIIFGYNIIKSNLSSQCDTSLKLFQEKTKAAIDGAARNAGSVNEFEYKGLCEIDEIYFVDKSKEIDVSELSDMPEIQGSVDSSSKDNVFLMMDNELEESFDIGDIDIPSPNYLCFVVNNGNLIMMLEGRGSATRPKHKENMFNCGSTIIEPTVEEVRDILVDDVLDAGTPVAFTGALPSTDENVLTDLFSETKEHVDMSREEIECLGNDAVVEIEISPKSGKGLDSFTYIERIPKECVDNEDLNTLLVTTGSYFVKGDPLIMWQFDDIDGEEDITYTITGKCEGMIDCESVLEGIGFAESVDRASNLNKGETTQYGSDHKPPSDGSIWEGIKKPNDGATWDADSTKLIHIRTKKQLEEGDRIIVYAKCDVSTDITLYEEDSSVVVGNPIRCIGNTEMPRFEFIIPAGTTKSKEWDLKADESVYYDFITVSEGYQIAD